VSGRLSGFPATEELLVAPKRDRFNGNLFFASYILIYLAAPVTYVGVVQAALCNKLGASAAVANLPASAYLFGFIAPFLGSWLIPHRWEQRTLVICTGLSAALLAVVGLLLLLPVSSSLRIAAVVTHGCIMGFTASLSQVFMLQCLARGTTPKGRARAFKLAFGAGPIAAVIGSLAAQHLLAGGSSLNYPYDFAFLYLAGFPCMAAVSLVSSRYLLTDVPDELRPPIGLYLARILKAFRQGHFAALWWAYFLFFSTLAVMPNLSLRTNAALGREPKDVAGAILALRFGTKSVAGFLLGMLALRKGVKAPMLSTVLLLASAVVWATFVRGWPYLFTFGLIGAGELGGAYFPNYLIAISTLASNPRNQAVLLLAIPAASVAPVLHGYLTDTLGFSASLLLAGLTIGFALLLVLRLPSSVREQGDRR
jgi:MFS family permease